MTQEHPISTQHAPTPTASPAAASAAVSTVTVPVGLGGKTTPYVSDPAPTLLVELTSVETEHELARIGEQRAAAESEAQTILESARSEADAILAEAASDAAARRQAAEDETGARITELEEREANLTTRTVELDDRASHLDTRAARLEESEGQIVDRIAEADAVTVEASAALGQARQDAEEILAEARTAAEVILDEARDTARAEAEALLTEARAAADQDVTDDRIDEIESVYRIELQVLHEREIELRETIARLEQALAHDGNGREVDMESARPQWIAPADDDPAEDSHANGSVDEEPAEHPGEGRHAADVPLREPATNGASRLASHAPLTEQLSINAFRNSAERDRRGRRRR